jgi:hypothetical protein
VTRREPPLDAGPDIDSCGTDVRAFAIRRRLGRRVFEVRWRVASHDKSRSFITRALAGSYHAELVRAARRGQEFSRPLASLLHRPPRSR